MSDEDISNELLALADNSDKPRKKRRMSSNNRTPAKRRRPNDSDDEPESEEDDANPYPIDGRYKDEMDRQRLMDMSELEREEILAQRLEEQQRLQDKINLEKMHKMSTGMAVQEDDSVSKAAKRKHTTTGSSKVKAKKLDELTQKRNQRLAKATKAKAEPSVRRARSITPSSGSDMEESDEEGQVSKYSDDDQKLRASVEQPVAEKIEKDDLEQARVSRDQIAKWCMAPFFEQFVKGAWVRYMVGNADDGRPVYRVCELTALSPPMNKTYKIENAVVNQQAELRHGNACKFFNMDRISNGPFTDREFDRLVAVYEQEKLKLPTKRALQTKGAEIKAFNEEYKWTDDDVRAMVARKAQFSQKPTLHAQAAEKSRLNQERILAVRRNDPVEIARIDALIASSAPTRATTPELNGNGNGTHTPNGKLDIQAQLAKVNERNRRANMEQIRKAEALEAEQRRRQRAGEGGLQPPTVRSFHSRGSTPILAPQADVAVPPLPLDGLLTPSSIGSPARRTSPKPVTSRFESAIAISVEVDLGDF